MRKIYIFLFCCVVLNKQTAFSQMSGTFTIDNTLSTGGLNFNNFSDAFAALNVSGVGGSGATFLVTGGQIFLDTPPELTATGNAFSPIAFISSGLAGNAKIMPSVPGTLTTSTYGNHGDGVVRIAGGDYIEFNGIDIEQNLSFTTAQQQYEYGYYILRNNPTDASQNVTIKNSTITLTTGLVHSCGIYASPYSATGTSVTPTATTGRAESLVFRKNTINAYNGIQLRGYNGASPYDLFDHFITVDSNSVLNMGGGSVSCYGVYSTYIDSLYIIANTITSLQTAATLYGINAVAALNAVTIINYNDIVVKGTSSYGINNSSGGSGTNNFVDISHNNIHNCNSTSSSIYAIYQSGGPILAHISYNEIHDNLQLGTSSNAYYNVWSIPAATTTTHLFRNHIYNLSISSTTNTGQLFPIIFNGGLASYMYQNNVHDITHNGPGSGQIVIRSNSTNYYCYNNFISRIYAPNSTNADAIRALESNSSTNQNYFYNTVYLDAISTSATTFGTSCLYLPTAAPADLRNNILVNLSTPGLTAGYSSSLRTSGTTLSISTNSNNNCLYAGAGPRNVLFYNGSAFDATIMDYHTRMGPVRESNAFSVMPPFVNIALPPYDMHIDQNVSPNPLSGMGTPVVTPIAVSVDVDGNTRNASTPDVGADEFTNVLAVDLISFSAHKQNINAILNWTVEEKGHKSHYDIEASTDGIHYSKLGQVNASTKGLQIQNYEFIHQNAQSFADKKGTAYYRLKMVDLNSRYKYSKSARIVYGQDFSQNVLVYPNPIGEEFYINITTSAKTPFDYSVCTITGKVVSRKTGIAEANTILSESSIKSYPAGVYVLYIRVADKSYQFQLVKQ